MGGAKSSGSHFATSATPLPFKHGAAPDTAAGRFIDEPALAMLNVANAMAAEDSVAGMQAVVRGLSIVLNSRWR